MDWVWRGVCSKMALRQMIFHDCCQKKQHLRIQPLFGARFEAEIELYRSSTRLYAFYLHHINRRPISFSSKKGSFHSRICGNDLETVINNDDDFVLGYFFQDLRYTADNRTHKSMRINYIYALILCRGAGVASCIVDVGVLVDLHNSGVITKLRNLQLSKLWR